MTRKPPRALVESAGGRTFRSSLSGPVLDAMQEGALRSVYRGVPFLKDPLDVGLYIQLFARLAPLTVIEVGAKHGGSALFFADLLAREAAEGEVITIDLEPRVEFEDPRIRVLTGDARDLGAVLPPELLRELPHPILVSEDSGHLFETSLAVLEFFDSWLEPGDYIVVEDGILSQFSDPRYVTYQDGPNRAVAAFLEANPDRYVIDSTLCDHYGYNATFHPNGWLRRQEVPASASAREAASGAAPAPPPPASGAISDRYIELLGKALLNETALEAEAAYFYARECAEEGRTFDAARVHDVHAELPDLLERIASARAVGRHLDQDLEKIGFSATMIGRRRLESLETCVRTVVADQVPGDLIECGVWRGGATIFMRGLLHALGAADRRVWVADSFCGLAAPDSAAGDPDLSASRFPALAVSQARVRANFERFGLLDEGVRFLEGWFHETLPTAPIERLAILRIDGDYYDSTLAPLEALYEKVSPGGYVIIDDYSLLPACEAAVEDFRAARGIEIPIVQIDQDSVLWRVPS